MRCKYGLSTPFFQHKENIVQTADTLTVESEHVQLAINSEKVFVMPPISRYLCGRDFGTRSIGNLFGDFYLYQL